MLCHTEDQVPDQILLGVPLQLLGEYVLAQLTAFWGGAGNPSPMPGPWWCFSSVSGKAFLMGLGGDRVRVGLQVDSIRGDPVTAGPPVTCDAAAPGSGRSLGHRHTRWAAGQLDPLPAPLGGVWPTPGSPKPGLWSDQRVLGKGPELVEASARMERLLVITCSSPGSLLFLASQTIFLSSSEHLKAS